MQHKVSGRRSGPYIPYMVYKLIYCDSHGPSKTPTTAVNSKEINGIKCFVYYKVSSSDDSHKSTYKLYDMRYMLFVNATGHTRVNSITGVQT